MIDVSMSMPTDSRYIRCGAWPGPCRYMHAHASHKSLRLQLQQSESVGIYVRVYKEQLQRMFDRSTGRDLDGPGNAGWSALISDHAYDDCHVPRALQISSSMQLSLRPPSIQLAFMHLVNQLPRCQLIRLEF